ncbi:MAG: MFS transporter, partial [Actinomycetes bacterium]
LALFFTPAGQLQNHYLSHERHLSALGISILEQVAGTIGGLGTLLGGRLADAHGRRPVAIVGVACGMLVTIACYLSAGAALWVWMILGSLLSYAVVPALAVYGGELFPTGRRGRAGGILTVMAAAGGVLGLVAGGALTTAFGATGPALAVLAAGPVALIVLIAVAYPETAREGLEDLNPEDTPQPRP